jgi:hypothetical protein
MDRLYDSSWPVFYDSGGRVRRECEAMLRPDHALLAMGFGG